MFLFCEVQFAAKFCLFLSYALRDHFFYLVADFNEFLFQIFAVDPLELLTDGIFLMNHIFDIVVLQKRDPVVSTFSSGDMVFSCFLDVAGEKMELYHKIFMFRRGRAKVLQFLCKSVPIRFAEVPRALDLRSCRVSN